MASPILVTGGTGTLRRLVVPRLRDAGCKVRVLSRHSPEAGEGIEFVTGDLATGEAIEATVEGAELIVHCAGSAKGDEDKARSLVRAASQAGARHLVCIGLHHRVCARAPGAGSGSGIMPLRPTCLASNLFRGGPLATLRS
jgi:uncharacterized protein YbjT (DUF2867 family)